MGYGWVQEAKAPERVDGDRRRLGGRSRVPGVSDMELWVMVGLRECCRGQGIRDGRAGWVDGGGRNI